MQRVPAGPGHNADEHRPAGSRVTIWWNRVPINPAIPSAATTLSSPRGYPPCAFRSLLQHARRIEGDDPRVEDFPVEQNLRPQGPTGTGHTSGSRIPQVLRVGVKIVMRRFSAVDWDSDNQASVVISLMGNFPTAPAVP